MGSPSDEYGRLADEELHEVTLTRDFFLAETEVTQAEWKAIVGSNPSRFSGCDDCPVEQVSWYEIVEYCNALSIQETLEPAYEINGTSVGWIRGANGYRLPTEAEWEYACRAGTQTAFYNGGITQLTCGDPNLNEIGWYCGNNSPNGTKPVAQKEPNAWGLYDMSGNCYEYCWDWYAAYSPGPVTDPIGPSFGEYRVLRGGNWGCNSREHRSARRIARPPDDPNYTGGFRLARSTH